jgi:hypothetical protein
VIDAPDNVIPVDFGRKRVRFDNIPNEIRVSVHTAPSFAELLALSMDTGGWVDVVQICSAFVTRAAGVTGWSQEMLDECAGSINENLCLHGFDVKVSFELTGPEAVRINVLTRRVHQPQEGL